MKGTKVGIIGNGNVGSTLARGLQAAGLEVRTAGQAPGKVRELAAWAEVAILAVPFGALGQGTGIGLRLVRG